MTLASGTLALPMTKVQHSERPFLLPFAAIHTFLVSLLFGLFKKLDIKKSPTARSRAVRPIGYFAVLQDAEQVPVPAVPGFSTFYLQAP